MSVLSSRCRLRLFSVLLASMLMAPALTSAQSIVALRHWFYPGNNDNFYTTDTGTPALYEWRGIAAYVYDGPAAGTVPLVQYYDPVSGRHFYTTGTAPGSPWINEGTVCYVLAAPAAGTVPLYRWFNTSTGSHYYSSDSTPPYGGGWVYEGHEGYVYPS